MKIGLAIRPKTSEEWVRLALSVLPQVELFSVPEEVGEMKLDLLVVDDAQPGPGFIPFHRALLRRQGTAQMIVLGTPGSPLMMSLEWDPDNTVFISKPYQFEVLKQAVSLKQVQLKSGAAAGASAEQPASQPRQLRLGYLSTLHLADLIQMLCMSQWSGAIHVENLSDGRKGTIYINVGLLIHARTGDQAGEEACHQMLHWGRCSFDFSEEVFHVVQSIDHPWQKVLLDGAKAQDEQFTQGEGLSAQG